MLSRIAAPARKRNAIANTAFGISSTLLSMVTGLVLVPVYLSYVGAPAYGVWLASGNVLAWFSIFDPGIADISRQRLAMLLGANRWGEVRSTLICGALAMAFIAALIAVLGMAMAGAIVQFLNVEDPALRATAKHAVQIAAVGEGLVILGNFFCGALQGLQMSVVAGWVAIAASLAVPLVRVGLLIAGYSLTSFAWAVVVQGGLLCLVAGAVVARLVALHAESLAFSMSEMRYLFSMSIFSSLARIAGTLSNNVFAVLVTRSLGPVAAVTFEVTRQPIEVARAFLDKPASSLLPSFAHLAGTPDKDKLTHYTSLYLHYLIWMLGLTVVGFGMFNHAFITCWIGEEFYAGPIVNGLLVAGLVTASIGNSCRLLLYAFGRIGVSSVAAITEALLGTVVAVVGVRVAGIPGVAATHLMVAILLGAWLSPRIVLWEYLRGTARYSLLRDAVLPSCTAAGLVASLVWVMNLPSKAQESWLTFAFSVAVTASAYGVILICLSGKARIEAGGLARRWVARVGLGAAR
jgi:O-antigen/teichoic acid export membrane protein